MEMGTFMVHVLCLRYSLAEGCGVPSVIITDELVESDYCQDSRFRNRLMFLQLWPFSDYLAWQKSNCLHQELRYKLISVRIEECNSGFDSSSSWSIVVFQLLFIFQTISRQFELPC